ncbi:carboxypeptidase-like regulatory domain-containing protein [Roseivirga sp. UBA1976]|uniref:carboxypeptidase-like regulatory domain-containing protein n=1 Tax=Roseivirga sp. UBA1976 TaxID=1947386 RepID=UPI00257E23D6|nr:carboxypeptidase-like regulatory domain-containing protein [Roseivirga sp. UBA1976]|tara:strand:+ start:1284 stop:1649 length:366 start_codon:yes stop_codon:yes gene_type:complete
MKKFLFVLLFGLVGFGMEQKAEAQIFTTKLKITVVDELGNVVPDAKVTLYANANDYKAEKNPVQEFQLTNKKGIVTFKGLNQKQYYVKVEKGDKTNAGGGEIISDLEPKKLNKANVVISEL